MILESTVSMFGASRNSLKNKRTVWKKNTVEQYPTLKIISEKRYEKVSS